MSKSSGKWWEVGVFSHYTFSSEIKREDLPSGTKIEGKCNHCGNNPIFRVLAFT